MPTQPDNPHDRFFKETFSQPIIFADFAQAFMPRDLLEQLNLDTLVREPDSFVNEQLSEHFADLLFSVQYGRKSARIALLLEHKSYPVRYPHFQLNQYLLNYWTHQVREKKRPTPIIPIVIYHGRTRWKQRPLPDYFTEVGVTLNRFLPAFDYLLFDLSTVQTGNLMPLKTGFGKLTAELLKNIRHKHALQRLFAEYASLIRQLIEEPEGQRFLRTSYIYMSWSSGLTTPEIVHIFGQVSYHAKNIAMSAAEILIQEGLKKGIQRGIDEGRQIGIQLGKQEGERAMLMQTIRGLLKLNMDKATIALVVGRSEAEIDTFIAEIANTAIE